MGRMFLLNWKYNDVHYIGDDLSFDTKEYLILLNNDTALDVFANIEENENGNLEINFYDTNFNSIYVNVDDINIWINLGENK